MSGRLPDMYFERMYAADSDPWGSSSRWFEKRKYAITLALLPKRRYRHAFEPGCSIGTLTAQLTTRCDHVTAVDVAETAVSHADGRLRAAGLRGQVTLARASLDDEWPPGPFDLVVLSGVAYYLDADTLAEVLRRECPRLLPGATLIATHWRHAIPGCPLTGDKVHTVIGATPGLTSLGCYRDPNVVIEVFDTGGDRPARASGPPQASGEVPGARR